MGYLLEENTSFSQSALWDLQRGYFEEMGFEAWRKGEVPHYVTTNPRIANSYAEMIFGFYKDARIKIDPVGEIEEPFYILEVGAGSGRFSFYLLKRLQWLCEQSGFPATAFKYIISDFTQSNADFYKEHPYLKYFFDNGLMDIAIVDMTMPGDIELQLSKKQIKPGSLTFPLTVVANYLFDSIPQELLYFKNGNCYPTMIALHLEEYSEGLSAGEILEKIEYKYGIENVTEHRYEEQYIQQVLDQYTQNLTDAYMFFPAKGISGIAYLRSLSKNGLMLLTADKGEHRLPGVVYETPPGIIRHGSFSISVNYHAIGSYCEQSGGGALFPGYTHRSIDVGCLLFVKEPVSYTETMTAFNKHIGELGPDDYFTICNFLRENSGAMQMKDVLAALRFSLYDSHQLGYLLPVIGKLLPSSGENEKTDFVNVINKCWENYFPLGEEWDLANRIGILLYEIDEFALALNYFGLSVAIYGEDTGTLFNMASCCYELDDLDMAKDLLQKVIRHDNTNQAAIDLLKEYDSL